VVVLALCAGVWPADWPAIAEGQTPTEPGPGQAPLGDLLDAQGSLDLSSGFRGSIDARGWGLVSGPDEAPAFALLAAGGDSQWSDIFQPPGTNGVVWALAADGTGNVYVGGTFTSAGGVVANNIARWNGRTWSALSGGLGGTAYAKVAALAVDRAGNLYAGGYFFSAGGVAASHIAMWDGSTWSALGSGIGGVDSPIVSALAVDSADNLYVGGQFTTAGGVPANHIAKWDGSVWTALGSGMGLQQPILPLVSALAVDGAGNLYAGGDFTTAGGTVANRIAQWNGSTWSALGSGLDGVVKALVVDGSGNLYAGGGFSTAGGITANRIARWDGYSWSALGSGVIGPLSVNALTVDGAGNLYAGGGFTNVGGVAAAGIARWNGSVWSALGSGIAGEAHALAMDGIDNLYVGGYFDSAGGMYPRNIVRWDGINWYALGNGMDAGITALAMDDFGNLYAGGYFTIAGGRAANYIAKWDGTTWSALGSGTDLYVYALAVDNDGNVYAGGRFISAGGVQVNYVAKWDGSVWSALGSGLDEQVRVLAVDDAGNLYAGGGFTSAGGVGVSHIAMWNGSVWSALGSGMNWYVQALAVDGAGNLYAGGSFTMAGGIAASNVAKWDGSNWSALGSGISGSNGGVVYALTLDAAGGLYAGGWFDTAGGQPASSIAKWDGNDWSALCTQMDTDYYPIVSTLAMDSAGNLYAGGSFTSLDGATANHIAKWNGSAWSALGGGLSRQQGPPSPVYALALDGVGTLYAGGIFDTAEEKPSANIGRWEPARALTVVPNGSGAGRVASNPYGIDCGTACGATFAVGTVVTLTAKANVGSSFDGWSGACSGTDACVVTMDTSKEVTATFALKTYVGTLTKAGNGSGNVNISPPGIDCGLGCNEITGTFEHGTVVTLTPLADPGSIFAGWSGACAGIGVCVVTINGPKHATATFVLARNLEVSNVGDGSGGVVSNPPGIDCGVDCGETYAIGTLVTLTATADVSSNFDGWSGACTGTDACVVTMDTSKEATATFALKTYVGTLTKAGNGSGNVNISPPGVNCGAGCNEITGTFTHGTAVMLTPLADPGSIFAGWSGACTGTGICVVTMIGPKQTTATFVLTRNLTVSRAGNGSGTVTSNPGGIACGPSCTAPFADGTVVTLTVAAGTFSTFTGWSGACTGTEACVVTLDGAKTVTATFTLQTFPLSVGKTGNGSGTVASSPTGIACGGTCSAVINAGTVVTLTALPDASASFTGWSGASTGTGACVVVMDGAKAVTATFTLQTFPLTVNKTGIGSGTVASSPGGITCGGTCSANFTVGSVVTLTATADAGSSFAGWSGACTGTGACAVTMNSGQAVTGTFGVTGAVTPQASTMYYGQQLQVEGKAVAAAPAAVTKLVVFTATAPAGVFLLGVEGSEPYAGEVSAARLINRLLAEGCGGSACSAVNVAVYAPAGTHTDFAVTNPVVTENLYLPLVKQQ
jgi:hypothetical protein